MSGDDIAQLAFLGILGSWIAVSLLRSERVGTLARQLGAWTIIIVGLVAAYAYRAELQDVGHRVTLGLVPGSSVTRLNSDGTAVMQVGRDRRGHFVVDATINDETVEFLVDTGATTIALSHGDAARVGINPASLQYDIPIRTANGMARAAQVRLDTVSLGGIERNGLIATVSEPGALTQSLLGMNFLGTLASFEIRGDRLILSD